MLLKTTGEPAFKPVRLFCISSLFHRKESEMSLWGLDAPARKKPVKKKTQPIAEAVNNPAPAEPIPAEITEVLQEHHTAATGENTSALGDKIYDTGTVPPNGRVDRHWGKDIKIRHVKLVGEQELRQGGEYYDPAVFKETFGLDSIEFGNWMNQKDRVDFLYACACALTDLGKVLGVRRDKIGMNGELSIAFGARGMSRAVAHYEKRPYVTINLTKTMGYMGALAHEYGHALDNFAAYLTKKQNFLSEAKDHRKPLEVNIELANQDSLKGLFEKFFKTLYLEDDLKSTQFAKTLAKGNKYITSRAEVFARTFEAAIREKLYNEKLPSKFLAESTYYKAAWYPSKELLLKVMPILDKIVREIFNLLDEKQKPVIEKEKEKTPVIKGGNTTTIETQNGTMQGKYKIVELEDLIPSHDPLSWKEKSNYPGKCQQRDYSNDRSEQYKVESGSMNLNPRFLVNDSPTAVDGAPIVTPKNVVLGGNGRTMMLILSALNGQFSKYRDYLLEKASTFGFSTEEVSKFKQPVLVRVVEIEMSECAHYSNVLNKSLTQGIDLTTETISFSRQLDKNILARIAEIFSETELGTFAQLFANKKASKQLVEILRGAKVITKQNASQFLEPATGDVSDLGRLTIERILLGALLEDKKIIDAARSYTTQILRVTPMLVQLKKLPKKWDLMEFLKQAILLEHERRAAGTDKNIFIRQSTMDRPDGVKGNVLYIWDALDKGPRAFAGFIQRYTTFAETEADTNGFSFREPIEPEELLKKVAEMNGLADDAILMNTKEVLRQKTTRLSLDAQLNAFLGAIPLLFSMLVWGPPGGGKSTLIMRMLRVFVRTGRVLNVLAEDGLAAGALASRINRTKSNNSAIHTLQTTSLRAIEEMLNTGLYYFCVIDSMNAINARISDVFLLKQRFPKVCFIFLLHATADGQNYKGKGATDVAHLVNIVVEVDEKGVATTTKNWFAPKASMQIHK